MSASLNGSRAASRLPALSLPKPQLTVVPRPGRRASRLPFAALVVAVLGLGLVGLLLLNTGMERGAYQVTALRTKVAALQMQHQALQLKVAELQDPQQVAERALRLGMVANSSPAFISLATGKVMGVSVPGVAGHRVDIGGRVGPTVGRLPKDLPAVAGAAASAGLTVRVPSAVQKPAKGGDTSPTSPRRGR
ncbi:MAG: hypothetical protein ACR2JU_07105 [Nocardioidaceae bacterium]